MQVGTISSWEECPGFKSTGWVGSFCMEFAHLQHGCVGSLSPKSKYMEVKLTGMNGCLSPSISSTTDWQTVQGVHHLSPYGSWERLHPHHNPELFEWKKMDGWMSLSIFPNCLGL